MFNKNNLKSLFIDISSHASGIIKNLFNPEDTRALTGTGRVFEKSGPFLSAVPLKSRNTEQNSTEIPRIVIREDEYSTIHVEDAEYTESDPADRSCDVHTISATYGNEQEFTGERILRREKHSRWSEVRKRNRYAVLAAINK